MKENFAELIRVSVEMLHSWRAIVGVQVKRMALRH